MNILIIRDLDYVIDDILEAFALKHSDDELFVDIKPTLEIEKIYKFTMNGIKIRLYVMPKSALCNLTNAIAIGRSMMNYLNLEFGNLIYMLHERYNNEACFHYMNGTINNIPIVTNFRICTKSSLDQGQWIEGSGRYIDDGKHPRVIQQIQCRNFFEKAVLQLFEESGYVGIYDLSTIFKEL